MPDPPQEIKVVQHAKVNLSSIGVFDSSLETFENYTKRVKIIFQVNEIKLEKQTLVFLSLIGPELFSLASDLLSPNDIEKAKLVDIIEALNKHFKPKTHVVYERYLFYERVQGSNESIVEFVAALKKQAAKCEFGEFLPQALRDQLTRGLKNTEIQQHLSTIPDLDFQKALAEATAWETAKKYPGAISNYSHFLNRISDSKFQKPRGQGPSQPCRGCGGMHYHSDCSFREAKCHTCMSTAGAYYKFCRSQQRSLGNSTSSSSQDRNNTEKGGHTSKR